MHASATVEHFFSTLAKAGRGLLLLDYDGTIAPFVADRMLARPEKKLDAAIRAVARQGKTHVAFVTGRPCHEFLKVSGFDFPVEVWGCHGREFLDTTGRFSIIGISEATGSILRAAAAGAEHFISGSGYDGAVVELKTGCLAVHWRKLSIDKWEELESRLRDSWRPFDADRGFSITKFNGGLELCMGQRSKGDAVEDLLLRHGQHRVPAAFIGDDFTDEDGFRVLKGRGLGVLARNEMRDTLADHRVTVPEGVLNFLHRWRASLQDGESG